MGDKTELKPCPFCGGEAVLHRKSCSYNTSPTVIRDTWEVNCNNNCCKTLCYESKIWQNNDGEIVVEANGAENAIKAWNRRVYPWTS